MARSVQLKCLIGYKYWSICTVSVGKLTMYYNKLNLHY